MVPSPESLTEVAAGSMPVNHQAVNQLQDALNSLPNLTGDGLKKSFASSILLGRWKKKGRQMRRRMRKRKGRKQVNQTQVDYCPFFNFILSVHLSVDLRLCLSRSVRLWDGEDYCLPAI